MRPTDENVEAWKITVQAARALNARIVVVQTPPSFGYSEENVRNVKDFFSIVDRRGIVVCWEPRGTWKERPDVVERLVNDLGLVHVVDLLKQEPLSQHEIVYTRLHGLNGEVNYRYKYTNADLEELHRRVLKLLERGYEEVYVLFNNVYMWDDARRFMYLVGLTRALGS